MLFDQVPQQCPERLAPFVFRQDLRYVPRNRIGASGSDFSVNSRQVLCGQTDSDL